MYMYGIYGHGEMVIYGKLATGGLVYRFTADQTIAKTFEEVCRA